MTREDVSARENGKVWITLLMVGRHDDANELMTGVLRKMKNGEGVKVIALACAYIYVCKSS